MWVWNPTANNYGEFNSASGVGTNLSLDSNPPMQECFVRSATSGSLLIDNSIFWAGNWFKN
jgi:hypothetical protein